MSWAQGEGEGAIRPDHPRAPDPVEMTESGVHAPNDNSFSTLSRHY